VPASSWKKDNSTIVLECLEIHFEASCAPVEGTSLYFKVQVHVHCGHWWLSRYSDWLQAGRSGDRIPVGARFPAPVQTGPRAHPASCTMGTGSFPGVKSGRGVTLTPHPHLVPWSWKSIAIPLLPLWAVRPVQSLSACTRVTFTFFTHVHLWSRLTL